MGKNFCVCNDGSNQEIESNIFSGLQDNKHLEKETIKTLSDNQITQNFTTKSFQDCNSINNYGFKIPGNEKNKNDNNNLNNYFYNNKHISDINRHDNFQCSGKFNVITINQNTSNGGKEQNDKNSFNNSDKNKMFLNKNEFSFNNFKTFIDGNNKITNKDNKNNNINFCKEINNNKKPNIFNVNNKKNDIQKIEKECKDIKNGIGDNYRCNNISQYSDDTDKEYLNNESNYYNSNKREENRDIELSLDNEEN